MTIPLPRFFAVSLITLATTFAGPRDAQWAEVDNAVAKRLPKTAIERLEPIITAALADKAYPEAVKAIARKASLETEIHGRRAQDYIRRLQAQTNDLPAEAKPVIETLLANAYWEFYSNNRWRFMERTATSGSPGPDIETWSLSQILAEIDRHFTAALANDTVLKATPIREYDDLLTKGTVPDSYRPTLYDFLVYEALRFYSAGEQAARGAEDAFEIMPDDPIFGAPAEFTRWQPKTTQTASPTLQAVRLYQALLAFHAADADRSAYDDADLARLTFAHNVAVGGEKHERYRTALSRFIETHAGREVTGRAMVALARQWVSEGELAEAHDWAERARAYPSAAGAVIAANLIQEIEVPSADVDTEQVWNAPWPTINVTYRNVTKLYFRAVPMSYYEYLIRWIDDRRSDEIRDRLAEATPALSWSADLPRTTDFKERTERLSAPATLRPGFYYLVASPDPGFLKRDNLMMVAPVWVSDLALILRTSGTGEHSGFVLDAAAGTPVAGAAVRLWRHDRFDSRYIELPRTKTDANGQFRFSCPEGSIVALAELGGRAIASTSQTWVHANSRSRDPDTRTILFTDRGLYRPGQSVQYKGVTVRADQTTGANAAVAGRSVTILFKDLNGQEIARATHQTNDYGSFSGAFTAPRDRLAGTMELKVDDGSGSAHVKVEEYKRPKFEVKLSPPVDAAKLNTSVTIPAKATSYTGAPIGNAKVTWLVHRIVALPRWCWWYSAPVPKQLGHGSTVTAADGSFVVRFDAAADAAVPAANEPVFEFQINADVTDSDGETRSDSQVVSVGYTALRATVAADDWQTPEKPVDLAVRTQSLDDEPQKAKGTVTVYALKQPATVTRQGLSRWREHINGNRPAEPWNPQTWDAGDVVASRPFETGEDGNADIRVPLPAGAYRATVETEDRFGKKVTARTTILVVDPSESRFGIKVPNLLVYSDAPVESGGTFTGLWGTGYDSGRAFVELECNGKVLSSAWTDAGGTQQIITLPITGEMRGGVTLRVTYVRENRAYIEERRIDVPWSNKKLSIRWERFRSKLEPGQKETWTAVITGPDAKCAAAEMVATLYDASLDAFAPFEWPRRFDLFRTEGSRVHSDFQNGRAELSAISWWRPKGPRLENWAYRHFAPGVGGAGADDVVVLDAFSVRNADVGYFGTGRGLRREKSADVAMAAPSLMVASPPSDVFARAAVFDREAMRAEQAKRRDPESAGELAAPDLGAVAARRNLNETAFFFPHVEAGTDGVVKLTFTMPEALTRWRFFGFAHDKELRSGLLTDEAVTAKDLMVQPNPPRFLREGDTVEFTVKVTNASEAPQRGNVRLTFADVVTQQSVDAALGNTKTDQPFDVPAKESRTYSWRVTVPDGIGPLTYKAVAASAKVSDGEEAVLPVLSRRVLVTESLPLPVRGKGTKSFEFAKLLQSGSSDTLRHQLLTVQMTSQPAWYAVLALPYLMEFPHECSEQLFSRYYANALARHIAASDPKIRRVFDLWKATPAVDSPLEKNAALKSVTLEETPWLMQARKEGEQRCNIGLLFDANRLDEESARTLRTLAERQSENGLWSWFPGGQPSEYISLTIVAGFGRLRHLGVDIDVKPAVKAIDALDAWMERRYRRILAEASPEAYVPDSTDALYLYARSFFLAEKPISNRYKESHAFFLRKAKEHWTGIGYRQSEAHLALALQRFGDKETAQAIVRSLKERSVNDAELGMFWRDQERSWFWYGAPIETQALMIEAFAEVADDAQAVEDCKVWLLKQKQTQDWRTTKATADAVYALLLRGQTLLSSDAVVQVSLGGASVKPENVEAGTGFYERTFSHSEIKPEFGRVTVTKADDGVSWGGVHWQYLEDVSKVIPHEDTPLTVTKALFVKKTTAAGPVLTAVNGAIEAGDELIVRIEIRTDRDLEFVHLKDQRGSGLEPVNVLSRYKYQDGLGYYESTRDTATHFFIEYLRKGTYVFEYSTRVQLRGRYQSGLAEIQCMYAPEFNSHSESLSIEVK